MAAIQNQEGKVSYLVYYGLEENRLHEKMYVIDYVETTSYKKWKETKLGELSLSAGACVLRLRVDKAGQKLCLSAFRLEKVERDR